MNAAPLKRALLGLSLAASLPLTASLALAAPPQAPVQVPGAPAQVGSPTASTLPAQWTRARLEGASYTLSAPRWEGKTGLVSAEQEKAILEALSRDAAGALTRRYPGAKVLSAPAEGAILVTPVLLAPDSLLPWSPMGVRLDFALPSGEKVSLREGFTVMALYQHGIQAANFAYDQVAKRLP